MTKRPYRQGRNRRAPDARLSQYELEVLKEILKRDGVKYAEWLRGKIAEDTMITFQIDTNENWRRMIGAGIDVHITNVEIDGTWVQFDVINEQAQTVKERLTKNGINYETC